MPSADDRALIQRDRALPGLDLILDAPWLARELDAVLPATLTQLAITSVRYKPGMSCLIGLDLTLDGVPTPASAHLFGPEQHAKLHKYQDHAQQPATHPPSVCVLDSAPVAAWIWPHDPRLHALDALDDPQDTARLIESCLGETHDIDACSIQTLRYKPHRRWTACVIQDDQPTALLKITSHDRAPDALNAATRAHQIAGLGAPRVIGSSQRRSAMGLAWIPGCQLAGLIIASCATQARLCEAGLALARLHTTKIRAAGNLPDWSIRHRLDAARRAIHVLAPALDPLVEQSARAIHDELADLPATLIHGDCSADQVLITDHGAVLIDFDRMAVGPAAIDLGRFAATLIAHEPADAAAAQPIMTPLLDAYRTQAPAGTLEHLPAATAMGLLELATAPFRTRSPGWSEQIRRIVHAASNLCGTPTHGP